MRARLSALIASPHVLWFAVALALVLALPTIFVGEFLDDHLMRAWALDPTRPIWDGFRFGLPGHSATLRERGMLGWWSSDRFSLRLFRPLSSLTHALDYRSWPDAVALMHLENVLIYVGLVVLVTRLVERVQGPGPVVGVAAILFAIDGIHGASVGWISARNSLLALGFGLVMLLAHLRWRPCRSEERGSWLWAALACLAFGLALLSAEAGLCSFGFVLAWSLCFEDGPLPRRLLPTLPYLGLRAAVARGPCVPGVWRLGSSIYLDPSSAPLTIGVHALLYPPAMSASQLALPLADMIVGAPAILYLLVLIFAGLAWVLAPLIRDNPRAQFWLASMLFVAVPIAVTYPTGRSMLPVSVGGAALVALAFVRRHELGPRLRRLALSFVFGCKFILAPLMFVPVAFSSQMFEPPHRAIAASLPDDAELCVVLNPPLEMTAFYPEAIRVGEGRRWPAHVYYLFAGMSAVEVERVGPRSLELSSDEGWAASGIDRFSRDWNRGFSLADEVVLERAVVRVDAVSQDGRPLRVRVDFDRDLNGIAIFGFGRDGADGLELEPWRPVLGERATFQASL